MMLSLALDAHRARRGSTAALLRRQRTRLAELVAFARQASPGYRALYANLPEEPPVTSLPRTDKALLMQDFERWLTDRDVTRRDVEAIAADPARVGERLLGRYNAATTSGTTGRRGVFLVDDPTFRVAKLMALRMLSDWLDAADVLRFARSGLRVSMIMATGGHYASAVAARRLTSSRAGARRFQVLSSRTPMTGLVEELGRYQPTVVAPYASMGALLATEQEAGRLSIQPSLIVLAAEGLPEAEYARIAASFGAKVRHSYAATECPFLSYSCSDGWLHVNADWVIVEPVDAAFCPVPAGVVSDTVLVTNLANRAQPILRYDLGDRILERPDRCPCGNSMPAIKVMGRRAETLELATRDGRLIAIPSLVVATTLDAVRGIAQAQVARRGPTRVALRLLVSPDAEHERARRDAVGALRRLLDDRGLGHVDVEQDDRPPTLSEGGKLRVVVDAENEKNDG